MKTNVNEESDKFILFFWMNLFRFNLAFNWKPITIRLFSSSIEQVLNDDIRDNKTHKEIIADIRELAQKSNIADNEVIALIWSTIMALGEWNKKEELVTDQALKHLKQYTQLLNAFATNEKAELALILKVQEFCYENMNFMKAFQKIIILFYQGKCNNQIHTNFIIATKNVK